MTTATTSSTGSRPRSQGSRALVSGLAVSLVAGLVLTAIAGVAADREAVYGALAGTAIASLFFGAGALAVDAISTLMPMLSLLVALMTYLLQVMVVGLLLLRFNNSETLAEALDARWLAGGVAAATVAWTVGQIRAFRRGRVLLYDLPADPQEGGER